MRLSVMKLDVNKYIVRVAGGVLLVATAYHSDPHLGLVTCAAFGGLFIGAAWADWRGNKVRGHDAAIVTAAKRVAQAYMTPEAVVLPQLQELAKVLYLAGWQPAGKK